VSMHAGIWNLAGKPVVKDSFATLGGEGTTKCSRDQVIFLEECVGILHRPSCATTSYDLEKQPYRSTGGAVIAWDGRLDNRDELSSELLNGSGAESSDVSIVGAAFDRWGKMCFAKIIGDWAVSIWDRHQRELIIARDYIGIKQLFYHHTPRAFIWCTDLALLAREAAPLTVCDQYVAGFLASFPDAYLTPYQQVLSVPPGAFVCIRDGKVKTQTYWGLNPRSKTRHKTDAEYEEHYRYLFRQAVRRRLRTDFPVLVELSGGFDSSAIICMADSILTGGEARVPHVDTISFYDPKEPEDDDFAYFTAVELKRGKTGFHVCLKQTSESLPFTFRNFTARPGLGVTSELDAALTEIARRHDYRVILSGSGGDDFNGQALDPRVHMADLLLDGRLLELGKLLTQWSLLIRKRPWIQLFFQVLLQLMPSHVRAKFTDNGELEPWVNPSFAKKHRLPLRQIQVPDGPQLLRPSIRQAAETIAARSRQMTSTEPWGAEYWYPFLDQDLVLFLTTIPLDQLLRPGDRRSLMRRALADLLPAKVLQRTTKAGLGRCFSVALEKHWKTVEDVLSSPFISKLGYVRSDQLRNTLMSLRNGDHPAFVLRALRALSLELWLRDVFARKVISLPFSISLAD